MSPTMDAFEYINSNGRDFFDAAEHNDDATEEDSAFGDYENDTWRRVITFSVSAALFNRLTEEAESAKISISTFIEQTLEECV